MDGEARRRVCEREGQLAWSEQYSNRNEGGGCEVGEMFFSIVSFGLRNSTEKVRTEPDKTAH